MEEVDDAILQLLMERNVSSQLMSTPLYPRLVAAGAENLAALTEQLRGAGHGPQAESLAMVEQGVPAPLRTMSAVVQRLLKRS